MKKKTTAVKKAEKAAKPVKSQASTLKEVESLAYQRLRVKGTIKECESRVSEIDEELEGLLLFLGEDKVEAGTYTVTQVPPGTNSYLDETLLLKNGVTPRVIAASKRESVRRGFILCRDREKKEEGL